MVTKNAVDVKKLTGISDSTDLPMIRGISSPLQQQQGRLYIHSGEYKLRKILEIEICIPA